MESGMGWGKEFFNPINLELASSDGLATIIFARVG